MKVAVFTNLYKNYSSKHFLSTIKKLHKKSIDVLIDENSIENMGQKKYSSFPTHVGTFSKLDKSFDFVICIGGDGTILRAASYVNNLSIPIIGVNTGRLGFLAKIQATKIDAAINAIINKKYVISERALVTISTRTNNGKTKNYMDFRRIQRNWKSYSN